MHPTHGALYQWLVTSSTTGLFRVVLAVMGFALLTDIRKGNRQQFDLLVLVNLIGLLALTFVCHLTTVLRAILVSMVFFVVVVLHRVDLRRMSLNELLFVLLSSALFVTSFVIANQFLLLQLFLGLLLAFVVYVLLDVPPGGRSRAKTLLFVSFISFVSMVIGTCFAFYY